jgi:hypothetical protein
VKRHEIPLGPQGPVVRTGRLHIAASLGERRGNRCCPTDQNRAHATNALGGRVLLSWRIRTLPVVLSMSVTSLPSGLRIVRGAGRAVAPAGSKLVVAESRDRRTAGRLPRQARPPQSGQSGCRPPVMYSCWCGATRFRPNLGRGVLEEPAVVERFEQRHHGLVGLPGLVAKLLS